MYVMVFLFSEFWSSCVSFEFWYDICVLVCCEDSCEIILLSVVRLVLIEIFFFVCFFWVFVFLRCLLLVKFMKCILLLVVIRDLFLDKFFIGIDMCFFVFVIGLFFFCIRFKLNMVWECDDWVLIVVVFVC